MKRLLIFLICSVLALSSLSVGVTAAQADTQVEATDAAPTEAVENTEENEEAAQPDTIESDKAEIAGVGTDADTAESGANADDMAPTDYNLLSEAEFQNKLAAMRSKYPNGSIWEGVYYEDGSAKAWTCFAYAAQMMYEIFGARYYGERLYNYTDYSFSGICAGDIVRIDGDSHSIFIIEVAADGFYFTDGNGTGIYNQVRWDGFYSYSELRSRFTYKVHLPGNDLSGQGISHSINYSANGGSGSMSSTGIAPGGTFRLKTCDFSRSGYSFAGYIVRRGYDDKWYTTDAGWQDQDEIYNNGYHYKIYPQGNSYTLGIPWIGDITTSTSFTFYAQWLPDKSTIEFADNYSGYNYILGSDLSSGYDKFIYSRDDSAYTMTVDDSEKLNNASSLKITGHRAGAAGADLAIITSTNKGYGNGYSQAGLVGDDKTFTLHFYAKSSVEGAKMFFRWGFTDNYVSVKLSKGWQTYAVDLPKNRFCGYALHPFFDKAGTYYLNSLSMSDIPWVSNVVPETGTWAASSVTVPRGEAPDRLPTPQRDGYVFTGWYTAAEGGNRISEDTPINESTIRLYAHWRKNISYTPLKTVKWNGHVYELYDNSLRWEEASQFCASIGGHIVTIGSAEENEIAYDMVSGKQGYCWIGLSCEYDTTDWRWEDDTPFTYNKWYDSSYGTVDTGEYYAMLYPIDFGTRQYASTWDKCTGSSYYCSYYGYYNSCFICEYDDPYFLGDTDGNLEVELIDATLIQRDCVGLAADIPFEAIWRADVNEDDSIDIIDVTYISRYVAMVDIPYAVGKMIK